MQSGSGTSKGIFWVVLQFLLLGAGAGFCSWVKGPGVFSNPWGTALGWAAFAVGGAFLGAGALRLGKALTPLPAPVEGASLRTDGVYGWVRHPIYCGVILLCVGAAVWSGPIFALAFPAVMTIFFDLKARREEAWLEALHPEYQAYRQRVRRLLPGIY
jgi:protein-S-isoprenylcysteine O-methyltransferase Ste14